MLPVGVVLLATWVGAAEPALKTRKDQVSYAMAVAMARSVQRQGVEIDVGTFARGMQDVLSGGNLLMTQGEMREALGGVVGDIKEKQKRAEAARAVGEGTGK